MANDKEKYKRQAPKESRQANDVPQRRIRNANRGNAENAEWSNANPTLLADTIAKVAGRGCAIQMGYTKDFGAYVIRIVGDGEAYNEYVRPSEDINLYLEGLRDDFTNGRAGE